MSDIIKFLLIIYGCISLTLLITYLDLGLGKAFVMFLFWPIYFVAEIIQAIIYDIKNGLD